jgi:hypothetical protein
MNCVLLIQLQAAVVSSNIHLLQAYLKIQV